MRRPSCCVPLLLLAACAPGDSAPPGSVVSDDGTEIRFSVSGDVGTPLVMVHGWACDQSYWRDQVAGLSSDFVVVTVDLAGHGSSGDSRTEWTIEAFAADVVAVVNHLELEGAVLVGHSMGGPVVVEAALRLPYRASAAIGVDTFHDSWVNVGAYDGILERMRSDFVAASEPFVRGGFLDSSPPELVEQIVSDMLAHPPHSGIAALEGLNVWGPERMESSIAALPIPLGVIQARQFAGAMTVLEATDPDLVAVRMPDLGHFLMSEDPDRFNEALRSMVHDLTNQVP